MAGRLDFWGDRPRGLLARYGSRDGDLALGGGLSAGVFAFPPASRFGGLTFPGVASTCQLRSGFPSSTLFTGTDGWDECLVVSLGSGCARPFDATAGGSWSNEEDGRSLSVLL